MHKTHDEIVLKNAKEATCTEEGYTGDKVCAVCGEIVEKGTVIPKTAHNYEDEKCTVCGAQEPVSDVPSQDNGADGDTEENVPDAGDNSIAGIAFAMMLVSALAVAVIRFKSKKIAE